MTNNWQTVKLGDICEFNPTESIKKGTLAKKIAMDKLFPFRREISGAELAKYSGGTKFRNGDTLIARITPCLENGKTSMVNILELDEVAFGSTEFIVLREKKNISDSFFLYYLSVSPEFRKIAIKSMVGSSGRQRVQLDVLKNLEISLPSLAEQERIAGVLSALDDKIENNNAINKKLEEMAQAIFKSYFIDFTPFNGSMPNDWQVGKLSDITEVIMGQSPAGSSYNEEGNGAVFYQGRTDFGFRFPKKRLYTTLPKRMAKKGSVLLSVRAPVGDLNIAFEDCCIGRGLASISSEYKSFIYYQLLSLKDKFDVYNGEGTVFGCINKNDLSNLEIALPSINVLKYFEKVVSVFDIKIRNNYKEINRLTQLRDSLLPKLMTGKVRV